MLHCDKALRIDAFAVACNTGGPVANRSTQNTCAAGDLRL